MAAQIGLNVSPRPILLADDFSSDIDALRALGSC